MDAFSIDEVRADASDYVWDNALARAREIEPGEAIELHVRDVFDEEIRRDSSADAVERLDFSLFEGGGTT